MSESTKVSPFFANTGRDPLCTIKLTMTTTTLEELNAQLTAERIDHILDIVKAKMKYAQAQHQEHADKSRTLTPSYQHGDIVWLDGRNIHTARPSRKLEYKFHGLFKIVKPIGTHAYELDLPNTIRNHQRFPGSLMSPAAKDPLPSQIQAPPLSVIVEGDEEWLVKRILDSLC